MCGKVTYLDRARLSIHFGVVAAPCADTRTQLATASELELELSGGDFGDFATTKGAVNLALAMALLRIFLAEEARHARQHGTRNPSYLASTTTTTTSSRTAKHLNREARVATYLKKMNVSMHPSYIVMCTRVLLADPS